MSSNTAGNTAGNTASNGASNEPGADHAGMTEDAARQILLARLADQPRSRYELAEWLARKNVCDAIAEPLLNRFEELGLIDDVAFAQMWIESRQRTKGLARRALWMELRRKGIDDEISRTALDAIDPETERQGAHRLVQKKLRSLHGVSPQTQQRRLLSMLARKGYPSGMAYDVVHDELQEQ